MFKLNQQGDCANKIGTGEWHNVESSPEYQAWIAEGNTPEPADPIITPKVTEVTMRQARLALNAAGILQTVEIAVAAAPKAVQIEWEFASDLKRSWPTLVALAAALEMTDQQVDDLFTAASQL